MSWTQLSEPDDCQEVSWKILPESRNLTSSFSGASFMSCQSPELYTFLLLGGTRLIVDFRNPFVRTLTAPARVQKSSQYLWQELPDIIRYKSDVHRSAHLMAGGSRQNQAESKNMANLFARRYQTDPVRGLTAAKAKANLGRRTMGSKIIGFTK